MKLQSGLLLFIPNMSIQIFTKKYAKTINPHTFFMIKKFSSITLKYDSETQINDIISDVINTMIDVININL